MPTASIGKLAVELVLNTGGFTYGMQKAGRDLRKFSADAQHMGMALTTAGGAIFGVLGAAIQRFTSYGDEIHDMAQRMGIGTKALSSLGYMATLTGADIEQIGIGIKRMSTVLVEASEDSKEAAEALAKLGLSATEVMKMQPDVAFRKIGQAITALPDPFSRAAAAVKIFGRSGTALLPLFNLGAEGMQTLTKHAERLGIVLGEEAAAKADMLADAWQNLKFGIIGLSKAIVDSLGSFDDLNEKITLSFQRVREWIQANENLIATLPRIAALITITGGAFLAAGAAAKVFAFALTPAGVIGLAIAGIGVLAYAIHDLFKYFREGREMEREYLARPIEEMAAYFDGLADAAKRNEQAVSSMWDEIARHAAAVPTPEVLPGKRVSDLATTAAAKLPMERIASLQKRQAGATVEIAKYYAKLKDLRVELEKVPEAQDTIISKMRDTGRYLDDLIFTRQEDANEIERLIKLQEELGLATEKTALKKVEKLSFTAPSAKELGTVEAYSAMVQPTYKAMSRGLSDITGNTAKTNKLLEETNRILGDALNTDEDVIAEIGDY